MKKIDLSKPYSGEGPMAIACGIGMLIGFLFFLAVKNNNSTFTVTAIAIMLISLIVGLILFKIKNLVWLFLAWLAGGTYLFYMFIAFEAAGKR